MVALMETKKCVGYKGVWACGDDYPDHEVPVEEFGGHSGTGDGLQPICRRCKKVEKAENNPKSNPRGNAVSAIAYKMAGGSKAFYELPKEKRIELRAKANVVPIKRDLIPRFDDGSPKSARKKSNCIPTGATKEGPGLVYIYQDERIPEDLKIGAEKKSHGRLAGAGTWGFYRCVFNLPFEMRYKAEREVHALLASKRIVSNKEIFKCSVEEAIEAIRAVKAAIDPDTSLPAQRLSATP